MPWRRALAVRRLPLLAALVAILLCVPAAFGGFQSEDWVFFDVARSGDVVVPDRINLFGHREPPTQRTTVEHNQFDRDRGVLPWTVFEGFDVSFWRPLTSFLHLIDYALWPGAPWLMHVHSLLWYGLLAGSAAALYRRLVPVPWIAGLAAVMYAADDAHGHAVGWIANRNAVVGAALAVLALVCHDRWRRDGWRPGAVLGPLLFGAALLGAELAVGALAYLIAHAAFVDRGRHRALATAPWVGIVALWSWTYRSLGHRALGCGVYLDPVVRPIELAFEAPGRAATLALAQLTGPPSDLVLNLPEHRTWILAAAGALVVGITLLVSWPLLRQRPDLRFFAVGSVLSLLPATIALPEDRLLLMVGLGAFGVVASVVGAYVEQRRETWSAAWHRAIATGLVGVWILAHGIVGPALLPYRSLKMKRYEDSLRQASDSAFAGIRAPDEIVILLDSPNFYFATMMVLTRIARKEPVPVQTFHLAGSTNAVWVERVDPHAVRVAPARGFYDHPFNRLYRSAAYPFRVGERIRYRGVEILIEKVNEAGDPLVATFRFEFTLEHPKVSVLRYVDGKYVRIVPPAMGQTIVLSQEPAS